MVLLKSTKMVTERNSKEKGVIKMTELSKRVEKALNEEIFEQRASVYIEEIDDYVTVHYSIQVVDPEELTDDLGLTDELNQLADKYSDGTALSDGVWDTVSDQLTSHPYDEPLLGVVSYD